MILRALAAMLCVLLAACASAAPATDPAGAPAADGKVAPAGVVDYSCKTDADCEVKNVGNCCGEYPACVNRDSRTFPQQVKAECAQEGRMAICGFPVITGCRCENARCVNVTDTLPAAPADVQ